jgi:cyclopropane fatty-acyl-phospholipid synthase-like methyltransferase
MFGFLNKLIAPKGAKASDKAKAAPASVAKPAAPAASEVKEYEVDRIELLQLMWGSGFSSPGDKEFIKNISAALTLDAQKSVIDMSAGLGGQARTLVELYKTYVTGFERDADLAFNGNKISARTGFGRTAPITQYDPRSFEYAKRADAIIARDLLYTMKDKDAFAVRLNAHLKDRGHLVLTDFTCDPVYLQEPAIALWSAVESATYLQTDKELAKLLTTHGFDVRVCEDITPKYKKMTMTGLAQLVKHLEGKKLTPTMKALLLREVDFWAKRLSALETAVRYTRIHAIKID